MAKIVDVPHSGSIANITYSHNKGGQYIRNRRKPTNPNSTKQQQIRSILSTLSRAWSGLTSTQQAQWNTWTSVNPVIDTLGQSMFLSGQQGYIKLNSRLLQSGSTASATPPAVVGPAQLVTMVAAWVSPFAVTVTYTATPLAAGQKLVVYGTLPASKGRNPNRNQARLLGYSAAAAASPAAITSPYPALAAQLSNLYVSVMDASGQISPGLKATVITT